MPKEISYNADMVEATQEQKEVLRTLIEWLKDGREPYITLGGYAGTGKTTLTAFLRKILAQLKPKLKVAFCAYTGKASRVLEMSLNLNQTRYPQDNVSTIHSLIYQPIMEKGGQITGWKRKPELPYDLIMLDEASMVDEHIFTDLLSYQKPIIAVGDHGQLPPIRGKFNLMEKPQITLEKIHRQAAESPIIQVSILARNEGVIPIANFGRGVRKLNRYDAGSGQEVEEILQRFNEEVMVLTGFNHTRIKLNQAIRNYLGIEGERPRVGDRVIALKNNWEKGIYNGMLGKLERIIPKQDKAGKIHWYDAEIKMMDEAISYSGTISAHQFNQATTLKEYEGLNYKSMGDLFDFGYALTVHKAQGSQAPKVLLFEERNQHMSEDDWRRWLYTGVTRAEEELTIVGA